VKNDAQPKAEKKSRKKNKLKVRSRKQVVNEECEIGENCKYKEL